jgi:hypothetical protein
MERTERSEMLAYKIQTPGNYPEESIQHKARNFRWAGYAECMGQKKLCFWLIIREHLTKEAGSNGRMNITAKSEVPTIY